MVLIVCNWFLMFNWFAFFERKTGALREHMCQGLNSHCFHIIGDGKLNPIVGVYIPIIRIPIEGEMTIPNIATFDHGTYHLSLVSLLDHFTRKVAVDENR